MKNLCIFTICIFHSVFTPYIVFALDALSTYLQLQVKSSVAHSCDICGYRWNWLLMCCIQCQLSFLIRNPVAGHGLCQHRNTTRWKQLKIDWNEKESDQAWPTPTIWFSLCLAALKTMNSRLTFIQTEERMSTKRPKNSSPKTKQNNMEPKQNQNVPKAELNTVCVPTLSLRKWRTPRFDAYTQRINVGYTLFLILLN